MMSVQFGKCNFDGRPIDFRELEKVLPLLVPHGPDGEGHICKDNFALVYCAFHTTTESRQELQPFSARTGAVITWDGRLDNREELLVALPGELSFKSTDLQIIVSAYEQWGVQSFAKLIGDWALSIWNPADQSLILAKDFVGARPLYYCVARDQVTWCTIIDPFVLFPGHSLQFEEEYIAGWLGAFPAAHLTPYSGIHSVPPSSFVRLTRTTRKLCKYWEFNPDKNVGYRTDAEYEEHFRFAFSQSIRRRLRSDKPVLAELSGGMDSSSIVCVADTLASSATEQLPQLDTISYYNESEPHWDEAPYFKRVEEQRGRTGWHLNISSSEFPTLMPDTDSFAPMPAGVLRSIETNGALAGYMRLQGYCVLLSGTGGDEVTGGVPTPIPELADLFARGAGRALIRQLKTWALQKRTPWFHLLLQTLWQFAPAPLTTDLHLGVAPWLRPSFVKRNRNALFGYPSRLKLLQSRPSFQENLKALHALRRQMACTPLPSHFPHEKRHPYLDRELLEFLFAIPRDQLVRPGQRRSLMRRALIGIVPSELLNRRRKAFACQSVLDQIRENWSEFIAMNKDMATAEIGVVEPDQFITALKRGIQDGQISIVSVMRTLTLECWLRSLRTKGVAQGRANCSARSPLMKFEASAS